VRAALVLAAVLAVAALLLLLLRSPDHGGPVAGPRNDAIADPAGPRPPDAAGPATEAGARIDVPDAPAPATPADAEPALPTATIRGRLVDAVSGLPVAGGTARIEPTIANERSALAAPSWPPWTATTAATSGPDGDFELRFPLDPACFQELIADSNRHAAAGVRLSRIDPQEPLDVGEVRLPPRSGRTGRVVDADDGSPIAELEIGVGHTLDPIFVGGGGPIGWRPTTRTGADGSFAFDLTLPPRPLPWFVATPGFEKVAPAQLGEGTRELRVRRLELACAGQVIGTDGAPLPATRVAIATGAGRPIETTTDEAGRFALFAPADARPIRAVAVERHRVLAPAEIDWGARDLRVLVPAPGTVLVRVVDAEGAPVERFRVLLRAPALGATVPGAAPPAQPGTFHPGGVCRLERVPAGSDAVLVQRAGERVGRVHAFPPLAEGGSLELTCRPGPDRHLVVEVVAAGGSPRAVAQVVVGLAARGPDPEAWPMPGDHSFESGRAFALASGITDTAGRAALTVPAEVEDLRVGASLGAEAQTLEPLADLPRTADGAWRITVAEPGPGLRIRVRGADALRAQLAAGELRGAEILVGLASGPGAVVRWSGPLVGEVASFREPLSELHPVRLGWRSRGGLPMFWPEDLGLAGPGQRELVVDAPEIRLASIEGRLSCATPGQRPTRVSFALGAVQGSGQSQSCDADGRFAVAGLLPGPIRFSGWLTDGRGNQSWRPAFGAPEQLAPGLNRIELRVPDIDLRLTVLDAEGRALPLAPVLLSWAGSFPIAATTDAAGRVAFRPAPAGAIQIDAGARFALELPAVDGLLERVLQAPR
jgi:hypothetical protein